MSTSSHCGGVPLFIKYGIDNVKRDDPSHYIHNISESIFVELKRDEVKIELKAVYVAITLPLKIL